MQGKNTVNPLRIDEYFNEKNAKIHPLKSGSDYPRLLKEKIMLTSKQRAQLRGMANSMDTILQIGKDGINDNTIKQVDDALSARELIKCRVLETSPKSSREAADEIAERIGADVVQVIGYRFILYRPAKNKEDRKIVLVKSNKK